MLQQVSSQILFNDQSLWSAWAYMHNALNYMHTLVWAVLTGELAPVGSGLVSTVCVCVFVFSQS